MRDFYELINQYPWTTIIIAVFFYEILDLIMSHLKRK
jgi:hypothetical protein